MKIKLLFTSLFLMLMSFATFAQNEKEPYVVIDEEGIATFYYNDSKPEGALPIPINMYLEQNWTKDLKSSVKKVLFDASFKEYYPTRCAYWFCGFVNLTEISGMKENLTTENVTTMSYMFLSCSGLTTLDLSNFNTENVEFMIAMFAGCSGLTSLDLSNFNTENVINMSSMFEGCNGLTSLNISNFNTAKVRDMDKMFWLCSSLTYLDVSKFNTENVTQMQYAFCFCSGLTSLDLSNFNTEKVRSMEFMFAGCSSLTSLDLSSFNTGRVTEMRRMFSVCSSLEYIIVGDNWTTALLVGIGAEDLFVGCDKLRGGEGTVYDESHTDAYYAHIDGGTGNPGYFTKAPEKPGPTPVSSIPDTQSDIKVWSSNSSIFIESAPDTKYKIIDLNGRILTTSITKSSKEEIHIDKQGVYVVLVNGESFKVAIQ